MAQKCKFYLILILLVTIIISVAGCEKVTIENYDKIRIGMDYKEVKKILGDPTGCETALGTKHCTWQSKNKKIEIQTIADKVIAHSSTNL